MTEKHMSQERLTRARFIRLGTALGMGAAGASVLAACGGGGTNHGDGTNGGVTEAATTSGAEETTRATTGSTDAEAEGGEPAGVDQTESGQDGANAIARERDVPPGSAVQFADESGQPAVLVHLEGGGFVAYSAVCTHQQCTVAYQDQTGLIACPCHGSVFDPANGAAVVNPPAQTPLPEIPVEVRNGEVVRA